MPSTLFLVYSPGKKFTDWTFPDVSKYEWEWVGSGSTGNSSLPYESQWTGPSKNKDKVKVILNEAHKKLQKKDVIDTFFVTSSITKYMKSSPFTNKKGRKTSQTTKRNRKSRRKTSQTTRRNRKSTIKTSQTTRRNRKSTRKTSRTTRTKKSIRKTSRTTRRTKKSTRKTSEKKTPIGRCGTTHKAKNINKDKTKQTSDKYITRNSPPYHASAYCGKNKKGNDGDLYFAKKMNNGTCRWIKL